MKDKHIKVVDIQTCQNIEVIPEEEGTNVVRTPYTDRDRAIYNAGHLFSKLPEYMTTNYHTPETEKGEIQVRARVSIALSCPEHGWYPSCNYTLSTRESHYRESPFRKVSKHKTWRDFASTGACGQSVQDHIKELMERISKEAIIKPPPPLKMYCPVCRRCHPEYEQSKKYWSDLQASAISNIWFRNALKTLGLILGVGVIISCWILILGVFWRWFWEYWRLITIGYISLCIINYIISSKVQTKNLYNDFWFPYEIDYSSGKEAFEEATMIKSKYCSSSTT